MRILVTYASRHGATRGIAERIADELQRAGLDVDLRPVEDVGLLSGYDAVVVGSAVYFGSWLRPAAEFVRGHRTQLSQRPVWLFSSGPVGETVLPPPKQAAEFETAIAPRDHRVFAGALDGGRLGLTERLATRAVHAPMGDSRNWDEIASWADGIASHLRELSAVASR